MELEELRKRQRELDAASEKVSAKITELDKQSEDINRSSEKTINHMHQIAKESERVADVALYSEEILNDLERKFDNYTGLTKCDLGFLFVAVALQIARQALLTKFPERLDDQTAAKKTGGHYEEHSDRSHRYYNPSVQEIITNPVPFDANVGANGALAGGGRLGHRVTALGHDPLIGLVVGTSNIATSTLTNSGFQSYHIWTNENNRDYFRNHASTPMVFIRTKDKLLHEGLEGKKKVGLSLMKEIVHLNSDLYTKHSLPLPIISVIDPKLASDLASMGLDMANVVTVGKQMTYSIFINAMISMIHGLFYDESIDGNRKLYEVRTRKVLCYSNCIASTANLAFVGGNVILGNAGALKYLDVGGLAVTLYRIATDPSVIRQIKAEFVEKEFFDLIRGSDYNFSD